MPRALRFCLVWILATGLLALHAAHFHHVVDDAYISFRYLRNALAGHGLVFNPGEAVEGYTNFLWILMLAPGVALGWSAPRLAAVMGVICMGAAVALRSRLASAEAPAAVGGGVWAPAGTLLLLCAWGPTAYWAAGGLETGVFCLCILLLIGFLWHGRGTPAMVAAGVAGALLCMARPDGIVYVGAAVLWLLSIGPRGSDRAGRVRACATVLGAFALVYVPYFLWRWQYYDALLPNTFYAKVGGGGAALVRGGRYVLAFLLVSGAGVYAAVCLAAGLRGARRPDGSTSAPHPTPRGLLAACTAAGLAFPLLVGGDQLAMFRFMVPVMMLAGPTGWVMAQRRVRTAVGRAGLGAILTVVLLAPSFAGPMARRVFASERPADRDRAAIGRWLHDTQPADTLVAVVPAGILPYVSELPTLDLVGLNDRHIARAPVPNMGRGAPGHERFDADYVIRRRPDLVFLGACRLWDRPLTNDELTQYVREYARFVPGVGALLSHPTFQADYAPRAFPVGDKFAHAWVRRDRGTAP